jgi:uncharacterized protein with NRDE domain
MCTVTYLPLKDNNFILTSNRDETPLRSTIPPKKYIENGVELTYPKDELAGGTWIGASDKNRLVCLLNGGFVKHIRSSFYKMSRGVIVKNILSADNAITYIKQFDFTDIEPFTLILVDYNLQIQAFELVWDGVKKHFTELNQEPRIWSSSTLYTGEMKSLREDWFSNWVSENEEFQQEKIVDFHQNDNLGNTAFSPKMKRDFVETVSITSVRKEKSKVDIKYFDILNKAVKTVQMK